MKKKKVLSMLILLTFCALTGCNTQGTSSSENMRYSPAEATVSYYEESSEPESSAPDVSEESDNGGKTESSEQESSKKPEPSRQESSKPESSDESEPSRQESSKPESSDESEHSRQESSKPESSDESEHSRQESSKPESIEEPEPSKEESVQKQNHFYNPNNVQYAIDSITIAPAEVYYNGDTLVANCNIYNGYSHSVYDININSLMFANESGTIASSSFGTLNGLVMSPGQTVRWTFYFAHDAISNFDADLSSLYCSTRFSNRY